MDLISQKKVFCFVFLFDFKSGFTQILPEGVLFRTVAKGGSITSFNM